MPDTLAAGPQSSSGRENGVLPVEEGGGPKGALVVTEDDEKGGFDSAAHQKIKELFG